jgi:broad specificity phosphatase PhoE
MKNTEIYFIRHGESHANVMHYLAGAMDVPLTDLGVDQAKATASALADVDFDAIYSSPLSRAYDTASAHAVLRGLQVKTHEGLRELSLGEWEGVSVSDIIARYGIDEYEKGWRDNFGVYQVPGGEIVAECGRRVFDAVREIALANLGGRVLIVSHGAALRLFWSIISGIAPEDIARSLPFPSNASYSVAEFDGEKFTPREFSVDGHLASVGITKVDW